MSKQQDLHFLIDKGDAIFVKLDAPFDLWFFPVCFISDYGECPHVGKLSPVTLMKLMPSNIVGVNYTVCAFSTRTCVLYIYACTVLAMHQNQDEVQADQT